MEPSNDQTRENNDSVSPPQPLLRHNLPPNATVSSSATSATVPALVTDNAKAMVSERSNNGADIAYLDTFPPGYRFFPHDHELILHYLYKKVHSLPLPRNKIIEVNLYGHNPETLAERFRRYGEKDWYFFTPRNKKYKNGSRPNRAAGGGFWKATGADKKVMFMGNVVGYRKALVFYLGRPPRGDKTNWIMHEFRLKDPPTPVKRDNNDMMLDEWVLCKIYKKAEKASVRIEPVEEQASLVMQHDDDQMATNDDVPLTYPSFDNYMQQHQFPFSEHLTEPDNFSMFNIDQAQAQPPSAESGSSSSQAKYEIFDHYDPMAESIYAPPIHDHHYLASPLDSRFTDNEWSVLEYQHGHDASWIDRRFQTTIYPADIKNSPNNPAS